MNQTQENVGDRRVIRPGTLERLRRVVIEKFATEAYTQVGMRDIIAEAGVSPKTVYKYFGNKDQLLLGCVAADLQRLHQLIDARIAETEMPLDRLLVFLDTVASFYESNPQVGRIVFLMIPAAKWMEQPEFVQSHIRLKFESLFADAVQVGDIAFNAPPELFKEFVLGGAQRVCTAWLLAGATGSLVEQMDALKPDILRLLGQ